REAGVELYRWLRRGDRLIITSLDRAFQKVADAARMIDCWGRLGVELHVIALAGPVRELGAVEVAEALAAMEKAARSERAAVSAARARYYGRPVNGPPPHGFERSRRPGTGEWGLIPDTEERALMKAMLGWHESGFSIDQIRQHLAYSLKLEFTKKRGRRRRPIRWNRDAIWRRIRAEMRLRQ